MASHLIALGNEHAACNTLLEQPGNLLNHVALRGPVRGSHSLEGNYKCIASSNKCFFVTKKLLVKKLVITILIKFLLLLLVRHLLLVARHFSLL